MSRRHDRQVLHYLDNEGHPTGLVDFIDKIRPRSLASIREADRLLDILCPMGHLLAVIPRPDAASKHLLVFGQGAEGPSLLYHLGSSGLHLAVGSVVGSSMEWRSVGPAVPTAPLRACPSCRGVYEVRADLLRQSLPKTGGRKRTFHMGAASSGTADTC